MPMTFSEKDTSEPLPASSSKHGRRHKTVSGLWARAVKTAVGTGKE